MNNTTVTKDIFSFKKLWQRFGDLPLPQTEDSLMFRCFVLVLVILGIISVDLAAGSYMSIWAVPLSMVGAFWSWRRRHQRNILTKFLLAMGMILALFIFLGKLFYNLNDTRFVLAELLVQVQILHSFDTPRRKDLGYSMVIGLILLGVAGTVSQSLTFAPLLLIFLIVAIPTLTLDYHSRLKINPEQSVSSSSLSKPPKSFGKRLLFELGFQPRQFVYLILGIVCLGLMIFAVMPRFSGYQLRSFPVDAPAEFQDRDFSEENSTIIRPGYLEEGEGDGTGQSNNQESPSKGPGKMDSENYYGFGNSINQNLRGTMEPKLVMRVRSQAPGFWRMLAFDYYNGQGWEISREQKTTTIPRHHWSYRFSLPIRSDVGETKDIVQTYSIVSDLPNIIPVLSYPRYVFFPTRNIAMDSEDSLRSPFYLMKGLTYTIISEVPYRDRTALGNSPEKYAPEITKYYLQIPPEIKSKVKATTLSILSKSEKPLNSAYEKALFLAQTLKQNYTIQTDLPSFEDDEDLVEAFLYRYKGGYRDHFSTVLTVMLRSIDIPARLTVGFAPGQFNPFTGYYLVYNTDAYALTEVYFSRGGWFTFDPIPKQELIPPSFEQNQGLGILGYIWRWVAGWLPSPIVAFFQNLFELIFTNLSKFVLWFWRLFSGSFIGFLLGTFSLVVLSFLVWVGFSQWQNLTKRRRFDKLPPMERLYQRMLLMLKERGYPKHPAQTPWEYVTSAYQHQQKWRAEVIEEITQAYVSWRYGEKTPDLDYLSKQFKFLKIKKG